MYKNNIEGKFLTKGKIIGSDLTKIEMTTSMLNGL
jgi:hypothetical protein